MTDKRTELNASSAIEAEALAWIAQLDGDNVTDKDLAAFREWIGRSPAHAREIRELNAFWGELNILTEMMDDIAEADAVPRQLRREKVRSTRFRKFLMPAGALAAVTLVSAIILFPFDNPNLPQEAPIAIVTPDLFKTGTGEFKEVILDDGSVLKLNTSSLVEVDFDQGKRRIRLLEGEASFDVAHDKSRPFLVFAGDGLVQAVGTAFTVHLEDGKVDLIVSEGAVELSSLVPKVATEAAVESSKSVSLGIIEAGQKAKLENSEAKIVEVKSVEIEAALSWQDGLIVFSGESLDIVVAEVNRYTDNKLVLSNKDLSDIRVGGVFRTGDTDSVIASLRTNFNINVTENAAGEIILSR